ncbi:hypothetical protein BDQ12DRAFT_681977 [Crucibulum laeve]|uniref:Uncharacterized protein n=1 Tax=Crucibulum laeve TaxID=68775 RepID=A0A5C3M582_9AGAR|nr:hypothetical protein BDQ12DRAFT_681977 [Crucibulum laeve]
MSEFQFHFPTPYSNPPVTQVPDESFPVETDSEDNVSMGALNSMHGSEAPRGRRGTPQSRVFGGMSENWDSGGSRGLEKMFMNGWGS